MSDLLQANSIKLQTCSADCHCQSVDVVLMDAEGEPFTAISLKPISARRLAAQMVELADLAEAQLAKVRNRQL